MSRCSLLSAKSLQIQLKSRSQKFTLEPDGEQLTETKPNSKKYARGAAPPPTVSEARSRSRGEDERNSIVANFVVVVVTGVKVEFKNK